jgi:hypothetical protein
MNALANACIDGPIELPPEDWGPANRDSGPTGR